MRIYDAILGVLGMTEKILEELNRVKKWLNDLLREQTLIEWKGLSRYHTHLVKLYVFSKRQKYYYPRYNRRAANVGDLKVPLEMVLIMFVAMLEI